MEDQSQHVDHVDARFNEAGNLLRDIKTSTQQGNNPARLWQKFQSKCDEISSYISSEIEVGAENVTSER